MGSGLSFFLPDWVLFPCTCYGVSFLYSRTGPVNILLTPVAAGWRGSARPHWEQDLCTLRVQPQAAVLPWARLYDLPVDTPPPLWASMESNQSRECSGTIRPAAPKLGFIQNHWRHLSELNCQVNLKRFWFNKGPSVIQTQAALDLRTTEMDDPMDQYCCYLQIL